MAKHEVLPAGDLDDDRYFGLESACFGSKGDKSGYGLLLLGVLGGVGSFGSQFGFETPNSVAVAVAVMLLARLAWASSKSNTGEAQGNGVPSDIEFTSRPENEDRTTDSGRGVLCNAAPAGPGGTLFYTNATEPYPFETDWCVGKFLYVHRPTGDPEADAAGKYPYSEHMHGRHRLWEMRWQMTFKQACEQKDVRMGLEQDTYHWPGYCQYHLSLSFVAAIRRAVGDVYQSIGQDPKATDGEAERPIIAFPLWVLDQIIVTPEGEQPPNLNDPELPTMGLVKAQDRSGFRTAVDSLVLEPGCTFTFCSWGVSRFADGINWRLAGVPMLPETRLGDVGINPPIYICLYKLKTSVEREDDRHLDSRKDYLFRMAYWSSKLPATSKRVRELLRTETMEDDGDDQTQAGAWRSFWKCCSSR